MSFPQGTRTSSAELGEPKAVLHSPECDFHQWKLISFSCFLTTCFGRFGGEHNRVSKFRPAFQKVSIRHIWIAARILEAQQIQPSIQASQILKKVVCIPWSFLRCCTTRPKRGQHISWSCVTSFYSISKFSLVLKNFDPSPSHSVKNKALAYIWEKLVGGGVNSRLSNSVHF